MICNQCPDEHLYVCDCNHPHDEHVYAGGCIHKDKNDKYCSCEGYSQKKRKKFVLAQ